MQGNFDLDPAQWATLRQLLDDALTLPPAARAIWIDALAPEYQALKPRLQSLLAHADIGNDTRWQGTLPKIETAQFAASGGAGHAGEGHASESERSGTLIGPYRLLRALGEGGMGEVWLALRSDMLQRRPVALKLPRLLTDRAALAERFAREREILAALNHPNIARLYDAGVTADGHSYLALEYVEGERIDSYCSRKKLDVPARLRLFLQVARAVAHAHANLIVHRDLKPSNILVTEEGEVRLLDFGIAKLVEPGETAETELTQLGGRALTPDYASPEQILGQPITTASDIYSLGVVLFELLTGTRPYRLKHESRAALEEAIVQAKLARPSEAATAPGLRKRLLGDLDTIALKALKKAPLERYATANALAEDIERHLANETVLAQPDSPWYRLRKFVARHRLAVSASAAVLLAIAAGAGTALWQAHVAIQERQRAQEVKEFIADIFREASPYSGTGGKTLSAVDLLQQAEKKLNGAMIAQPEVRIELATLIGESLMALGEIDAAEPALDRAALEARQALGERHGQTVRIELLQSQIHRLRGRAKEARSEIDRILPALRSDPATKPIDLATALAHRTLIAIEEAAYTDAETFALEGARLAVAKLSDDNEQKVASAILLALAYRYTKKFGQSRDAAQVAYRAAVTRFGESAPHPRVVEAKTTYGRALADTGELAAGIALIDSAVADLRTLTGSDSLQVGVSLQNLVAYRIDLGDLATADRNAAEALQIVSAQVQSESLTYAGTLSARAHVRLARRDAAAALAEFSRAVPILERVIGAGREATLLARTGRALALSYLGHFEEAQQEIDAVAALVAGNGALQGAVQAGEKKAANDALSARVAQVRGTISRLRGELSTALREQQPVAELEDMAPKVQRERMRALAEIGLTHLELNDPAAAAAAQEPALADFHNLESHITPARADVLTGLARARLAQGRAADALPLLESAHDFWQESNAGNRWAGETSYWLARCQQALGHAQAANDSYRQATAALAHSPWPSDAQLLARARSALNGPLDGPLNNRPLSGR